MASLSFKIILLSTLLQLEVLLLSFKNCHALEERLQLVEVDSIRGEEHQYYHTVQVSSLLSAESSCKPSSNFKGPTRKGSLRVVHRHGPCSPLARDQPSKQSLAEVLSQDQSRVDSLHARLAFNKDINRARGSKANLPAQSGSFLGSGNFIVTVGLGSPKKDLSLIFDTGSDLTWTQCEPCVRYCYKQQQPIFDPSESATYANVSCSSNECSELTSATGNEPGCSGSTCIYGIQYGDSSFSVGFFAKDKLTLTPYDVLDGFYFGCGQNNRGLFGTTAGLIGLGRNPLSIVSQAAKKYGKYFSYCLPSKKTASGHLTFGKSAVPAGTKYTPFGSSPSPQADSFYFIDILAIAVGGRQLSISPSVFKTAGTIIDSGTVITRLPPAAYSALSSAFKKQMAKYPTAPAVSILDTCYDFSNYTTVTIPKISFTYSGDVKIDLDVTGIFVAATTSTVCLAFVGNSDPTDIGIFGNIQQQTFEVVYDVAGGKLGFAPGVC